jgi:hypothetical protein
VDLRANQRWLRKQRRDLLATIPIDPFMHHVQLSVIEGVIDEMKTPAGAAEFMSWLRERKAAHAAFWATAYLRG